MTKIEHPDYYNHDGRLECWDEFIERWGYVETYIWCLLTAEKYLYRGGYKEGNPEEQDLQKAFNYFKKATSIRNIYHLDYTDNHLYNHVQANLHLRGLRDV